jgi:hypothetical protein
MDELRTLAASDIKFAGMTRLTPTPMISRLDKLAKFLRQECKRMIQRRPSGGRPLFNSAPMHSAARLLR